ncbi:MAG: WHG domain-containing protein [Solirubrobacterales bacterium]|nr:WHG domain-containing protein [Solirubrobacterales bacterium]
MEAYAAFHRDHPLAFRLLGDLQDPRIEARLEAMLDRLAAALRRAAAAGALREVPAKRTARVMWASANGLLALHARGGLSQRELRASLALQVDVWLAGLSPAAGPA